MDNDKRIMLALALSLAVFLGYSIITDRYAPKSSPREAEKKETELTAKIPKKPAAETKTSGIMKKRAGKQAALKEEAVIIETPLFKAEFTTLGAGIKKWELKKYGET